MLKRLIIICLVLTVPVAVLGGVFLVWGYFYITRDLPQLFSINDYRPPTVSLVYANDGTVVGEFFKDRRYMTKLSEVPGHVRQAFLASEDAAFYSHPGIDPMSILRALYKNLREGEARQGGSTITQQVVKNLLLSPEKKLQRKIKEAILSYRLENRLTKDEIFEIYLNQIFFGNTAYGVKAASRLYFKKELNELTLAEAAVLAGLPKAPSRFSPILHPDRAKRRQRYVLVQMIKAGFISREEAEEASREPLRVYSATTQNIFKSPFFVSEVRRVLQERWRDINIDTDGLQITTSLDLKADEMMNRALRRGLREADKRRGWRGPIGYISGADREAFLNDFQPPQQEVADADALYPALVTKLLPGKNVAEIDLGWTTTNLDLREAGWARKRLNSEDRASFVNLEGSLRVGDVVEVSKESPDESKSENEKNGKEKNPATTNSPKFKLDQTPEIEGALVLANPNSGEVLSVVGGYSYQRSVFNRATQSLRQPGSAFKPIVYLAAIDQFHYTPTTIVFDSPRTFRVGDQFWTPGNFDAKYLGPITLRVALEKSRNLVSADIVSRIGVDAVIQYARKLGIRSPMGRNLSIALGSSEVTVLELTRAYGVFAAKGVLFDSVFVTKIVDRNGNVLFDYENERLANAKQVIKDTSAFLMAYLMKGVVEHGTGYRVRALERPVAGKTGTSNEEMDTWFLGYTPQWVCGVWVGFDQKRRIGEKETGGRVAAPVFLYAMRDFLAYQDENIYNRLVAESKAEAERLGIEYVAPEQLAPLDFSVPEGVDPLWVDKASGRAAAPGTTGAILEYFEKGTEPNQHAASEPDAAAYLESPEL